MDAIPRESVENTIPVIGVADVCASIDFYCKVLGFQSDWMGSADDPQIASVSRDGHAIMLQRRQPVTPGCVWIGMSEIVVLWNQIRSDANIVVLQRPTNQTYALDLRIQDPDGNMLWFGTEPLKDVPAGHEVDLPLTHISGPL